MRTRSMVGFVFVALSLVACSDQVFIVASGAASGAGGAHGTSGASMTGNGGIAEPTSDAATSGAGAASCDVPVTGPGAPGPGQLLWSRGDSDPIFVDVGPNAVTANALGESAIAGPFYREVKL